MIKMAHLFKTDDCHCGAGDHDEDTEDEEDVEDLVSERTLGETPVRNLKRRPRHVFYFRGKEMSERETCWRYFVFFGSLNIAGRMSDDDMGLLEGQQK